MQNNKLYIVYSIDTEGPLHEPLEATFERLKVIFGLEIKPTKKNLYKLQNQEIDLGGKEEEVAKVLDPHLLDYNDTWDKVDLMLDKIMTKDYRDRFLDSRGRGIVYNWHCVDHVGFITNERRRDIGYGNIYKHFKEKIDEHNSLDQIHWHFHPLSYNKEAHIVATSYDNSMYILHQVITRRVIDHDWFPTVNRTGFHAIRQDSNLFLEQWIPFDFSNQSEYSPKTLSTNDLKGGRLGDWRRAPKTWKPYHPSHDDYQTEGQMNRYTTKCLNIGTRLRLLTDVEIIEAFKLAQREGQAILSFTNHDFRDMEVDINDIYHRIFNIAKDFEDVDVLNCDAVEAMQRYLYSESDVQENALRLEYQIIKNEDNTELVVTAANGMVFGSQPYLAIKTTDGRYFHDNFDEFKQNRSWSYVFDRSTLYFSQLSQLKVAANDKYGNMTVLTIALDGV